jgi:hypothetical protein
MTDLALKEVESAPEADDDQCGTKRNHNNGDFPLI